MSKTMDRARRNELLQQYAERPPQTGVFAIRNVLTGESWVGHTNNVDSQKNSLWVRLSGPPCSSPEAQAAFKTHGQAAFSYDVLERITETDPHVLERLLPERAQHWRERLGAGTVKGT